MPSGRATASSPPEQQREKRWKVEDGGEEERARRGCRPHHREAESGDRESHTEDDRPRGVDAAREARGDRGEAHQQEGEAVDDGLASREPTLAIEDREHRESRAGVVVAVDPGDGQEVGDLPEEEDREEHKGPAVERVARRRPADHGGKGSGHRAHERRERSPPLQRRVGEEVARPRGEGDGGGQPATQPREQREADRGEHEAEEEGLLGPQPPRGQGTRPRPEHERVGVALQEHVHRTGPRGHERRSRDDGKERQRTERSGGGPDHEPDEGREHDERRDPRLGELEVVGEGFPPGRDRERAHAVTGVRSDAAARSGHRRRRARRRRSQHVPSTAAPTATCAVVGTTAFAVRTVAAPSPIWVATRARATSPCVWSAASPDRRQSTASQATAPSTTSAPIRCAKWMATAGSWSGGTTWWSARGKSGMASPAPVWRMSAPSRSWTKTTTVAASAMPRTPTVSGRGVVSLHSRDVT